MVSFSGAMRIDKTLLLFANMVCLAALLLYPAGLSAEPAREITRSSPYRSRIPAEVKQTIKLPPGGYHEGLFIKGGDIWVNNGRGINTWIVSLSEGKVTDEIVPPGTFSEGIIDSSFPDRYWISDWDTRKLYRVEILDGKMLPDMEISFDPALPTGVTREGDRLFLITWTRGLGTRYHLHEIDKNGIVKRRMRIRGIPEPSQICWDGDYLWITSWYNRRVYRIEPGSLEVTGHFTSPARDTTGIAWDGEYFWITGTRDDLYRVKVDRHAS